MNARAGFFSKRPDALGTQNMRALAGPILICMILGMMILPLPAFLLDLLFTFNIALSVMVLLRQHVHAEAARLRRLPDRAAVHDAAAPVAERRIDARRAARRPHRPRCGGQGDRGVRPLPRRRQLRGRHRRVRDPDGHQLRGDHEGRGAHRRSRRALHARRDARQADGDRRRPERRPHQRGAGARSAASKSRRKPTSTARWTARASSCAATRSPAS